MKKIELLDNTGPVEEKFDGQAMFKECFIDVTKPIGRQPIAISIGQSMYKGENYPIAFGSYGDYSCIVGASKSKKTFLKSAIIAAYIGGRSIEYFPQIKGHREADKIVVEIDTEQSPYHSQRVFKRVTEMVGTNYERYFPFSLRAYSVHERIGFVEWIFNEWEHRNDIGLISIDGFVDLVTDFNSLEQSTDLQDKLLKWTSKAKCHITGVLHSNFGSDKPVGHIGSAVLKKAETVVFVETNEKEFPGTAFVKCKYSRNLPFDNFEFQINENWLPQANESDNQIAF